MGAGGAYRVTEFSRVGEVAFAIVNEIGTMLKQVTPPARFYRPFRGTCHRGRISVGGCRDFFCCCCWFLFNSRETDYPFLYCTSRTRMKSRQKEIKAKFVDPPSALLSYRKLFFSLTLCLLRLIMRARFRIFFFFPVVKQSLLVLS